MTSNESLHRLMPKYKGTVETPDEAKADEDNQGKAEGARQSKRSRQE